MPDGVANARWVTLICWAGACLSLLDWLSIEICKIPEISHRLVYSTQHIILRLSLVILAVEINLTFIFEGVPEVSL